MQELKLQELSLLEEADYEDKEEGVGKESLRRPSRTLLMETRPVGSFFFNPFGSKM